MGIQSRVGPALAELAGGWLDSPVWSPYEGGEVSELGGAHLHEVNLLLGVGANTHDECAKMT